MERLPPDALEAIVDCLWEENLLHDRMDIARDACALACVGNAGTSDLSKIIFARLDPGFVSWVPPEELSPGVTVAALKGLLKGWGLRVTGNKSVRLAVQQLALVHFGSLVGAAPARCCQLM